MGQRYSLHPEIDEFLRCSMKLFSASPLCRQEPSSRFLTRGVLKTQWSSSQDHSAVARGSTSQSTILVSDGEVDPRYRAVVLTP